MSLEAEIKLKLENYETNNPELTRDYLESKGWKLKAVVQAWLDSIDAYPQSIDDYDFLFEKNGFYLEVEDNNIILTHDYSDRALYRGSHNSKKFSEIKQKYKNFIDI
jgi:hypothetical protein